jgi:hypothetical protein
MLELEAVLGGMLERLELAPVASELARLVARAAAMAPRGGGRIHVLRKRARAFAPGAYAEAAHGLGGRRSANHGNVARSGESAPMRDEQHSLSSNGHNRRR